MSSSNQKVVSAALLGVLLGLRIHHTWAQQRLLGREAYLIQQGQHFDKFLAVPRSMGATILGGLIVAAIFVGAYELIAAGISKVFGDSLGADPKVPGVTNSGL